MSSSIRLWIWTAAAIVAALLFNIGTASARSVGADSAPFYSEEDCPPDIPQCWLVPQQSVQIDPGSSASDAEPPMGGVENPVPVPIPSAIAIPISDLVAEADAARPINAGRRVNPEARGADIDRDVTCGVRAIHRALSAIDSTPPTYQALLGFLSDQGMIYDFGTGVEELAFAAQAFGYRGSLPFHGGTLDHLLEELGAARPVVVALGTSGEGKPGHFVVVSGVSADREWVTYDDPVLGERTIPREQFEDLWAAQGSSGVAVRKQVPGADQGDSYLPWVALLAGLMALITQTPLLAFRRGVGGRLSYAFDANPSTSSTRTSSNSVSSGRSRAQRGTGPADRVRGSPSPSAVNSAPRSVPPPRGELTAAELNAIKRSSTPRVDPDGGGQQRSSDRDPPRESPAASRTPQDQGPAAFDRNSTGSVPASLLGLLPEEDRQLIARTSAVTRQSQAGGREAPGAHGSSSEPAAPAMPDWLRRNACPPWISTELWEKLPPEDREHALVGFLDSWNGWVQEAGSEAGTAASRKEWEVQVQGGKLLQVSAGWLNLRAEPGANSGLIAQVPMGWAVRWTGRVQEVDGRDWYEVLYNGERGWVSSKFVEDYVPPAGFPATKPGHVWVPLPGLYSFSFYVVVDVDNYVPMVGDPVEFGDNFQITLIPNSADHTVPYGSLFSVSGVAMQGSGKITLKDGSEVYFTLKNPAAVHWMDATGEQVISTSDGFVKARDWRIPSQGLVQVMNPDEIEFTLGSRATELTSYISVAGSPKYRGSSLYAPGLAEHSFLDENRIVSTLIDAFPGFTGEFSVQDGGGAFPPGEQRFDLFIEEYEQGLAWYRAAGPERAGTEVYILHNVGTSVP